MAIQLSLLDPHGSGCLAQLPQGNLGRSPTRSFRDHRFDGPALSGRRGSSPSGGLDGGLQLVNGGLYGG